MNNESGKFGEDYTANWLHKKGCQILSRNYHSRWGEIDIIAQKESYIVFVEVKTRSIHAQVSPIESVTFAKQEKIRKTAMQYLQSHPEMKNLQPRFDVAAVTTKAGGKTVVSLEYLQNAF